MKLFCFSNLPIKSGATSALSSIHISNRDSCFGTFFAKNISERQKNKRKRKQAMA